MSDDRVVLTAELKDEMSAPLAKVRSTVAATASAVESANRRQSSATTSATAQIDKAISKQRGLLGALPGVFSKAGDGASRMFSGAKSAITTDLNKIVGESKSAGQKAGDGFAKGMRNLVGGAIAGLSIYAIAGVAKEASAAMQNIERINAQTASVIASTGSAAGVTAEHVEALAGSLENATAAEAEAIQTGANFLLTFKEIKNGVGEGNDVFDQATVAMTDMSRATGGDMQAAALQLGKALNDPIKGVTALSKVGVGFTAQQKEQIKVLQESGDMMGAQKIILGELNSQFGGSGAAYAATTAGQVELLGHAWGTFTEAAVAKFLPALGKFANVGATLFNWLAESPALDWFAGLVIGAGDALMTGVGGLRAFSMAFAAMDGDVTSSGFAGWMERAANALNEVRTGFGLTATDAAALGPELSGLAKLGADIRSVFDELGGAFGPLGPQLLELLTAFSPLLIILTALLPVLPSLVASLTALAGVLASTLTAALTVLTPIIDGVLTGFASMLTAITDAPGGAAALTAVILTLTGAFVAYKVTLSTIAAIQRIVTAVKAAHQAVVLTLMAAQYGLNAASLAEVKAGKTGAIVYIAKTAAMKAATIATTAATVAGKGLNAVFKANPIGLLITGIIALGAGLVWFFTKTETGQAIVQAAWQGIKGAISGVVDFWNGVLMPALAAVGTFFSTTWSNITTWVSGAVSNIMAVLGTIGAWFASTFGPSISAIGDVFAAVFSWIGLLISNAVLIIQAVLMILGNWLTAVFAPVVSFFGAAFALVWTGIQWAVQMVVTAVMFYVNGLVLFWQTILLPALQAVGSFFAMIWNGILAAVNWVIAGIMAGVGLVVGFWNGVLVPALQFVGSIFAAIWNGIVAVVQFAISGVMAVVNGLVGFWNGTLNPAIQTVAGFFSGVLSSAIGGVTGFIDKVISGFSGFVSYIQNKVQPIIDTVSGAFTKMGDVIGGAMSKIGEFASNPLGGLGDWASGIIGGASGGGVFSGGGVVSNPAAFAGGGVLGGYSPGKDTIPAILSKGEAVLVPEVVRAIGPQNIMAANRAASGRKAGGGPSLLSGHHGGPAAVSQFFAATAPAEKSTTLLSGGGIITSNRTPRSLGAAPSSAPERPLAPVSTTTATYGGTTVTIEKIEIPIDNSGGGLTPEDVEEMVAAGIEKGIDNAFKKARKRDY